MNMILEQEIMIDKSKNLYLPNLPVIDGEIVKIIILQKNKVLNQSVQEKVNKWQTLFKTTQALSEIQSITEDDIQVEIDAYRNGQ